jgi:hypothetical protein
MRWSKYELTGEGKETLEFCRKVLADPDPVEPLTQDALEQIALLEKIEKNQPITYYDRKWLDFLEDNGGITIS